MPKLTDSIVLAIHLFFAVMLLAPGFMAIATGVGRALPKNIALIYSILVLSTGVQNFAARMTAGVPKGWHMWAGIKILLALHIIAVNILASRDGVTQEKQTRLLKGVFFSGIAIILIAGYLGYLGYQPRT
ncbi:MAG: hypothetical protein K2Q23_07035 [Bryobacteraceae bacterium]|nr:hypothetical protein [Bryobacteraceae bacterium]